ncbi:MAG: hypothetical protein JWQ98_3699 [Chlorobi bacterium]|nr:hypothetical protein [Chlorobiota bacterium]
MHSRLVDFLNHGLFAFVGRSDEIERIASFWRSGLDANRLRMALLIGEAGAGKSRLVVESIPRIAESGGAVAHIKLYPESTSSIVPLITRALRAPILHRQLHLGDLDNTLFSSISALRRLARLRPAMLVIEDVHLLSGPALGELALLLEALSDEPISILCVARPMELAVRPIAERYLTMEIRLRGLTEQDIEELWMDLFQIPIPPLLLLPLCRATRGNPLAIRSALRGAIQSGALLLEPTGTGWRSQVGDEAFIRFLRRNVELLSEGMAAHLDDQEKKVATRLAWLGEIFSREAAELMFDRMEPAVASLMFKGVIAPLIAQPSPLTERQSNYPALTFTHAILHDHLSVNRPVDGKRLIEVIASGAPLYSILPFQLLHDLERETGAEADMVFRAIARTLEVARELDRSPEWELAMEAWMGADHLCRAHAAIWDRPTAERLEAMLIANHLTLLRRSEGEEEYGRLVRRLVELTSEPVPEHLLEYRLIAHTYLQSPSREATPETYLNNWELSREFVNRHPTLRYVRGYLTYLEANARAMLFAGNQAVLSAIEHELTELIASENVTDDYRHLAKHIIVFHYLDLFDTEEELQRRLAALEELEPIIERNKRMSLLISKIILFDTIGRAEELIDLADQALPLFKEQKLANNYYYGSIGRISALAMLGADIGSVEESLTQLCNEAPEEMRSRLRLFAWMALVERSLLRGDTVAFDRVLDRGGDDIRHLRPEILAILAVRERISWDILMANAYLADDHFRRMLTALAGDAADGTMAAAAAVEILASPILRIVDIIERMATLEIIERCGLADADRRDVTGRGIGAMLEWLEARRLTPSMLAIIERFGRKLPKHELRRWRERIDEIVAARTVPRIAGRERIAITMLGNIAIRRDDGEPTQIRGSRLRTLIGVLVADRMLDQPLSHRELAAIVAGVDNDPDKARRTLNGVVFRLRETIGQDAILTDGETPRLNVEMVDVDLLDAHQQLRGSTAALRHGSLLRAQNALLRALEISHGEVPFPTLYENFFEALRDDFESEMRDTIVKVAKGLLLENDPKSAEDLLRRGMETVPEDEELAAHLRDALVMLGKRAEAERIRIRMMLGPE